MNLYDIAIAKKLSGGGGGGGGGDSDFAIATATVINNIDRRYIANVFNIFSVEGYEGMAAMAEVFSNTTTIVKAVTYKEYCEFWIDEFDGAITVTGGASYEGDGFVIITGDCTITISQN